MEMTREGQQARQVHATMVTTVSRLIVYAFPPLMDDFDPNCVRLVTRGGDLDTAVPCLIGFIRIFCRADYYKILQGSYEDRLWLEELKIDGSVVRRWLRHMLTGSEPSATMDDVSVLFGVLLCNVNSKDGTDFNHEWFQNRVNDLVALFPAVSEPPPVPLYSELQAASLSAFGEQWPYTTAQIVCTIVEGRFQGPMKRLQKYVCEQWRIADIIEVETQEVGESEPEVVQQAQESAKSGPPAVQHPQEVDESTVPVVTQPPDAVESGIPLAQWAAETAKCDNPAAPQPLGAAVSGPLVVQHPWEAAIPQSPVVQEAQQVSISEPPSVHLVLEVATSESPLVPQQVDVARSKPPAVSQPQKVYMFMTSTVPRLTVYAFPLRMRDFNPNWIPLVTRGGNIDTAVACLLGLIRFFCRADYYKVLQGSDKDCLWLDEWHIDRVLVDRQLRNTMTCSGSTATIDDVYVLFGVLLCNVNSKDGTDLNQEWFQNRVNDLVALFPAVSEPPPVPLYSELQAAALSAFGEQWPNTAAHIVCTIVEGRFQGPMKRLQKYVCEQWRIADIIEVQTQEVGESEPEVVQQAQESAKSGPPAVQHPQEVDDHRTGQHR